MVLAKLIQGYSKTDYGNIFNVRSISDIDDYRQKIPIVRYSNLENWFKRVRDEHWSVFLNEEPITWVMTRGTTGESKIIPVTPRHLQDIIKCGARAVLNWSMKNGGLEVLSGEILNLQFPSNIKTIKSSGRELTYGFSSGTYAKLNPMMAGLSLIPRQEDIDSLQSDLTQSGWEKRYEFIYEQAKERPIISIIGVAPVQTGFARYVKRKHRILPKDLWSLKVIYSTSVAKIQQEYAPKLNALYGDVPVVEMYTATEGAFAQQRDKMPYLVPNYDTYLFEVRTNSGIKLLNELRRGEWGRLIISTSILPRYEICDLIEAKGKGYFRVFGRDKIATVVEHILWKLFSGWAS
jgi:hypothetical protein